MIVTVARSTLTVLFTILGSEAKRRFHIRWLISMTGVGVSIRSSSSVNVRPSIGRTPRISNIAGLNSSPSILSASPPFSVAPRSRPPPLIAPSFSKLRLRFFQAM